MAQRILTLQQRPFRLDALRQAILSRRPAAAVARLVDKLEAQMSAHQAPLRRWVEQRGGRVIAQWWLVNGLAVEIPAQHLATLAQQENVATLSDNRLAQPGWIRTATNSRNHRVTPLHNQGIQGVGTTIAVLDTGFDSLYAATNRPHRTFYIDGDVTNTSGGGLAGSRLLANHKVGTQPADDIVGHGTMVAAIAGGETWGTGAAGPGHAPKASLVGYSIADRPNGGALLTTIISGLQRMVSERAQYGTQIVNLSYEGTNNPSSLEQQALDSAAWTGDLLIAVMAGNTGASNAFSHAAANVVAVGLARADAHEIHQVSSRGPLPGGRTFPDIVANGELIVGPMRDDETVNRITTGTSNASPQVAGAAALYRSLKPTASALETKAALLASTEDVSQYNPNGSVNSYGMGYLRDDTLIGVAQGAGAVHVDPLTPSSPTRSYTFAVTAGKTYAAVVAWHRQNSASASWSNLELTATRGAIVVATSNAPLNPYEKVTFQATQTGSITFEIRALSFEPGITSLATAVVILETPPTPRYDPGARAQIGTPCRGSFKIFNTPLTNGLDVRPQPVIGRTHEAVISRVLPDTPVALVLGLSKTNWGSIRLPLSLTPVGGTNCSIYISLDRILMRRSTTAGVPSATYTFSVPNDPSLVGQTYYAQGAAADAPGNPMGMTTTAAIEVRIGN